jgi:hypothetical protein
MRGDDNIIGGDSSAERNVVSANAQGGIRANPDDLAAARRNTIQGNYVGLDADGDEPLGNGGDGIRLIADPMETGETMDNVVAGNVVGANAAAGISIFTEAHDNQVFSNFVGVTQSGDPIGNAGPGVLISGASGNEVGSTEGDGNTIANNGDAGVKINNVEFVTNHNTIRGNSIHTNTMLGIDLSKLANDDIQAPVITGPLRAGAEIAGTACSACTIDIYSDDVDEGRIYEGSTIANGAGNWSFSQPVSGPFTTATATDSAGNTSEFSAPVVSPEPPTPTPTSEPTETPEPTATPTPGPTETPEPTQTPQPSGTAPPKHIHGDTDCDADADSVDALFVLREVAGFPPSKCIFAGDVDCDGDRDSVDALGILRHVAALPPLVQQEPCPDIGTPV